MLVPPFRIQWLLLINSSDDFAGIEPHVTLFQYDLPQVIEDEYNGWLSPQIMYAFYFHSLHVLS